MPTEHLPDSGDRPADDAALAATVRGAPTIDEVTGVDEPDTAKTDGHAVVTLTGGTL